MAPQSTSIMANRVVFKIKLVMVGMKDKVHHSLFYAASAFDNDILRSAAQRRLLSREPRSVGNAERLPREKRSRL